MRNQDLIGYTCITSGSKQKKGWVYSLMDIMDEVMILINKKELKKN